jgi:molybdopterin synthase catalytic subunit
MSSPLFAVTDQPLDASALTAAVSETLHGRAEGGRDGRPAAEGPGAIASFLGLVRNLNQGRRVVRLEYEAYEPLAVRVFERIGAEVAAQWPETVLGLHHRVGLLAVGDVSVAIAAASPHRADAFAACRYAIERVKQVAPIWKREWFDGGETWLDGAVTDPDDATARAEALRIACA